MKTKIFRGLFCFLLLVCAACSDGRSIGTLVHEGPVARGRPTCLAAVDGSAAIRWVSVDGRSFAAPETQPPLDLAYDRRTHELLAVTDDGVLSLDPSSAGVTRRRASTGVERVWPAPDGLLVMQPGGLWTHERESGETITRRLPEAISIWERDGDIFWIGAEHPRSATPVMIRGDAASPLTTATVTSAIPEESLAAPGPMGDELMWAHLDERGLVLTHAGDELVFELAHGVLRGLLRLSDTVYAVALEEPGAVLLLDWATRTASVRGDLEGPIAGPVVCPPSMTAPVESTDYPFRG